MKKQKTAKLVMNLANLSTGEVLASGSVDTYVPAPTLTYPYLSDTLDRFVDVFKNASRSCRGDTIRITMDFCPTLPEPQLPLFNLDVY